MLAFIAALLLLYGRAERDNTRADQDALQSNCLDRPPGFPRWAGRKGGDGVRDV